MIEVSFLPVGSGKAHSICLPNFRTLCGFIKPISKLFDWVKRHELTLLKALWMKHPMQQRRHKYIRRFMLSITIIYNYNQHVIGLYDHISKGVRVHADQAKFLFLARLQLDADKNAFYL